MDKLEIAKRVAGWLLSLMEIVWDFVWEYALVFFLVGLVALMGWLLVLASDNSFKRDQEIEARSEYCYEQGYNEVIQSEHPPYWYCFDARRDGDKTLGVPVKVWDSVTRGNAS